MDKILHYLKDPKLWELWYIPELWVMQDFVHQPYNGLLKSWGFGVSCVRVLGLRFAWKGSDGMGMSGFRL